MASSTKRNAKRGPVIMPVEPPYSVLRAMAGDPLILAANIEQDCRLSYAAMRGYLETYAKRKRT